jgi:uridine phosphorylase
MLGVSQTMSLGDLSSSDRDLIRRSLAACADGPFFEEWEFQSLFGLTRSEFRDAARRWAEQGTIDAEVELAVCNAVANLMGYPHGMDGKLQEDFGVSPLQLDEVFSKWRSG